MVSCNQPEIPVSGFGCQEPVDSEREDIVEVSGWNFRKGQTVAARRHCNGVFPRLKFRLPQHMPGPEDGNG
jgi:hypothetical protein